MARRRPTHDANAASGLFADVPWGRLSLWLFAGIVLLVMTLFSWHLTEEFLIKDNRFRVAEAEEFTGQSPNLVLEGVHYASASQIRHVFAQDFGRSLYLVPLQARRQQLLAIDWVEDAAVSKIWPDTLRVTIRERVPVAFVRLAPTHPADSVTHYALIDRDGYILRPRVAAQFTLPVLSGLRENESIEARRARVMRAAALLKDLGPLSAQVSEVDASDPNNLVVAEHVGNQVVNLMLGEENYAERLQNFLANYNEIREKRPDVTTLDLRVDGQITAVGDKKLSGKTKLAVGLDLGASSTRVVICALEDFSTRFLGYGEAPAQAWTKARLSDQEALAESIRVALHEAEKKAQASPDSALIGVGGCVAGINSRGIYEFGRRREIEPDDLKYAVELAARVRLEEDREILQICPQDFTLDGRAGYRNPKGILGARLEANILVVTVSLHEHQAIVSAVHRSHLAVEESVFEGVAAAYASVVPEDRARGVCRCRYRRAIHRSGDLRRRFTAARHEHPHRRRSLHARSRPAVQGELRFRRKPEARSSAPPSPNPLRKIRSSSCLPPMAAARAKPVAAS